MHKYSNNDLYNRYVQEQAREAFETNCISKESYINIVKNYITELYTPNYFIRIAMAVMAAVATLFSAALLFLISGGSNFETGLFFILAIFTYTGIELLVQQKNYFNAGVDNTLMAFTVIFVIGIFISINASPAFVCFFAFVVCGWLAIRFVDSFMAMSAYTAIITSIYYLLAQPRNEVYVAVPFVLMALSAACYFVITRLERKENLLFYHGCLSKVKLLNLISFYGSCNFYVVDNLRINFSPYYNNASQQPVPLGILFWITTLVIPPAYIAYGVKRKDIGLMRAGFVLEIFSILTFKYYYAVLRAEVAMLVGGVLLTAIGLVLMSYLKTPRKGFVFDKAKRKSTGVKALEALVLIETTGNKEIHQQHTEFGGGSFGGGGAGSEY